MTARGLDPFYTETRRPSDYIVAVKWASEARRSLPVGSPDALAVLEAVERDLGVSFTVACPTGGAL